MKQQTIARLSGEPCPSLSPGRSIRLFLADGTPQGVITAEIMNWTGQALSAPRARLPELLRRPEAARTGVYVLMGPDPDRSIGTRIYIGEADNIALRLRDHLRSEDKDFFDRLVIIVAKDDHLTKAHTRYLESRLLWLAREVGVVSVANETRPDFQLLPEADKADMQFFLGQLRLVLPILGFDIFRRPPAVPEHPSDGETIFTFSTAGASATARETEDGFIVLAGSTARRDGTDTFPAGYRAVRERLVQDGHLVDGAEPELYRFAVDIPFGSPSAAASIVAARSASGPREWKVKGTGQLYRDWRAERLDQSF
jgi:hypothetical protein